MLARDKANLKQPGPYMLSRREYTSSLADRLCVFANRRDKPEGRVRLVPSKMRRRRGAWRCTGEPPASRYVPDYPPHL